MKVTRIKEKESVLNIYADCKLKVEGTKLLKRYRSQVERYINRYPQWGESFLPIEAKRNAPSIVKEMSEVASLCGVGPSAAVAGAIAEFIGKKLLKFSPEIVVENGGDIFLQSNRERFISVFAGPSKLSEKIALKLLSSVKPYGIATSSATVGHSYSKGRTDATVVISNSAVLSDAAATALGNMVKEKRDIKKALNFARGIPGLKGAVIIFEDILGIWNCEIAPEFCKRTILLLKRS